MGTFTHPITLYSASGEQEEKLEALVDTGSSFNVVPAPILERLGVRPHRVVSLRMANGQVEQRPFGRVTAELNNATDVVPCVFGEPNSPPVIGAVTLEIFLLSVDPVEGRLAPVDGYWM